MLREIATERHVRASTKIETLLDAACAFDASAFDMLTRIEADLVAAVERGDWETVELLAAERRLHRETRGSCSRRRRPRSATLTPRSSCATCSAPRSPTRGVAVQPATIWAWTRSPISTVRPT